MPWKGRSMELSVGPRVLRGWREASRWATLGTVNGAFREV
jgi:hypothetical protein